METLQKKIDALAVLMREKESIEDAYLQKNRALFDDIEARKEEIRKEIIERGVNVETHLMYVSYRKGAIRWNTKALEEYGVDHPEVMACRYRSNPTVGFSLKSDGMSD